MTRFGLRSDRPAWFDLAAEALQEARIGHLACALDIYHRISAGHGPTAAGEVLLVWIDSCTMAMGVTKYGQPVTLSFHRTPDGPPVDIDREAVAPEEIWAGRLIAARVADDKATFDALLVSTPDETTWHRRVIGLLIVVSRVINFWVGEPS